MVGLSGKSVKYSKTCLNRPTNGDQWGWLRDVEYCYNVIPWTIAWDPNKAIDIGVPTCGGGRLEVLLYLLCA